MKSEHLQKHTGFKHGEWIDCQHGIDSMQNTLFK